MCSSLSLNERKVGRAAFGLALCAQSGCFQAALPAAILCWVELSTLKVRTIRGIKLLATDSHRQYDGIYRFVVKEPLDNHVFDKDKNPLGVLSTHPLGTFTSKPYVLEYKQNVDALIQEFENQEKQESDVDLVIAWEIGTEWKKRYSVTSLLDVENIQHRPVHGISHIFRDVNSGDIRFHAIILSELVDALNDFDATEQTQRLKYGDII